MFRPRLIGLGLAVLLGVGSLVSGCAKPQEKALLKVGPRKLTVEDFIAYAQDPQVVMRYMMLPDSLQKKALFDDIESYELLAAAGTEAGFTKDSTYVHLADQTEPRLLQDALYDKHIGGVLKVSEDEARIFYESPKLEYRLGVIMLPDSNAAHNVLQRLAQGEPFASVAKTTSSDPGTAQSGGEVPGWLSLMQLSPAAEAAVQPLHKGQHTGAIVDRTGVFVFTVLDTRPRKTTQKFEEVKEQMMQMLEQRKKGALVDRYLADLRRQADLKLDGKGWPVVDAKIANLPDSLAQLLGKDDERAGLTGDDRKQPLATWSGHTYTVGDLTKDFAASPVNERPPVAHPDMFRTFVEGKVMTQVLVAQAKREGLDKSPEVKRQIDRAKSAYLVQRYVAQALPASKIGTPTTAELDSVTRVLVNASMARSGMPAHDNMPMTFASLPPQVQDQIANDWRQKRQAALLKDEVARLKTRMPPVVDQRLYQSIPWPVPAPGRKENA